MPHIHRFPSCNQHSSGINNNGAAFVEFVIALPIFVLLFLGFVDYSRYTIAQAMLESAANKAVSVATVAPDIDSEDVQLRQSASQQIESLARRIATAGFVADVNEAGLARLTISPTLHIPPPIAGKTQKQVLEKELLKVSLAAEVTPVLPFVPTFTISAEAWGRREPRSGVSLPIPVDCMGQPIGSWAYNQYCECEGQNEYWDAPSGVCKTCNADGYTITGSGRYKRCTCVLNNSICQERLGQYAFKDWMKPCECTCGHLRTLPTGCGCSTNEVISPRSTGYPYVCECVGTDPSQPGYRRTNENCIEQYGPRARANSRASCYCYCLDCGPGGSATLGGNCSCSCNPSISELNPNGTCSCLATCGPLEKQSATDCTCSCDQSQCGPGQTIQRIGGVCQCIDTSPPGNGGCGSEINC